MEHRIRIADEGREFACAAGGTLLDAMIAAGVRVDAPCGGHGSCGKCAVEIRAPGGEWQQALACQTRPEGDLEVRGIRQGDLRVLMAGRSAAAARRPWVERAAVRVEKCAVGDNTADWERFAAALSKSAGREGWRPNLRIAAKLEALLKRTGGEIWALYTRDRVLDVFAEEPRAYMAAFDLGTTSIVGYLLDASDGSVAAQAGMLNPQVAFGADVISRADFALSHGVEPLSDCVRRGLDELLGQLCAAAGIERSSVYAIDLVGNTCMHHLFLGISPASLARAPYNPAISEALRLRASDFGFGAHPAAELLVLPVIAGFVGADTVGCLLSGGWEAREERALMIDIGTNGELVMGNCRRMIACSTAAGPAFEGAKISCGMRGADGAIDHVWVEDGALRWHVIGEAEPIGICGSGLVDLAAALLELGEMDESGRLERGAEYRLGDTKVALTQRDVRELQMAKAAIRAGIELMAKRLGLELTQIESVEIAGAFGNYMNPDSACKIGMIPMELRDRVRGVGNAAGEGAKLALTDRERWQIAQRLARGAEFLELATLGEFQDVFVDALGFPEEDEEC